MHKILKDISMAAFWGILIPGILLNYGVLYLEHQTPSEEYIAEPMLPVKVLQEDGTIIEQNMDDYLVQVLLAEIPASFEAEALKAQSVAARTYARKAYLTGGKHNNGCVCKNPGCCQAAVAEEEYLSKGGTQEGIEKIRAAINATSDIVLTYDGTLIDATYFSSSGGYTESAVAVWGTDIPYLQAVPSPEEDSQYDSKTVYFSKDQFLDILGIKLDGEPENWFGEVSYTEGGGVAYMYIGGQAYTGLELRKLLGLRSTSFSVSIDADRIAITTLGFGHRVGMSQYGANAMAQDGHTYAEILFHYYPGTKLEMVIPTVKTVDASS